MLMNTTFLGDSFSIKWQSRVIAQNGGVAKGILMKIGLMLLQGTLYLLPDFATCSILTIEKNVENTAFGLYFFYFML